MRIRHDHIYTSKDFVLYGVGAGTGEAPVTGGRKVEILLRVREQVTCHHGEITGLYEFSSTPLESAEFNEKSGNISYV